MLRLILLLHGGSDRLQVGEVVSTIPSKHFAVDRCAYSHEQSVKRCACCDAAIGFNVESVTYKNIKFQVWDLGGQTSIRPYWRCYYPNTQAIIYVVDSSDTDRVGTSREEFHAILQEEELRDALLLVYANKQASCPVRARFLSFSFTYSEHTLPMTQVPLHNNMLCNFGVLVLPIGTRHIAAALDVKGCDR